MRIENNVSSPSSLVHKTTTGRDFAYYDALSARMRKVLMDANLKYSAEEVFSGIQFFGEEFVIQQIYSGESIEIKDFHAAAGLPRNETSIQRYYGSDTLSGIQVARYCSNVV